MIMIFFSEFAQKMGRVIKGKATNGDFTFRLLTAVLPEKKKDLIGNIPNSTLRNYYNGISGITQIARKIYADASTASFEKFINDHGKNARTKLSEVFSDVIPEITPENTGKNLAKLFLQIIKEAAQETQETLENEKHGNVYMNGKYNYSYSYNINNSGTMTIGI